jgi:hypothetical protein
MDEVPNHELTKLGTEDGWIDALLKQASPIEPDETIAALDAKFTARVISALPRPSLAQSYWRTLPLAAVLGTVSIALWYLKVDNLTLTLDRPATLSLQLLPLAVLYWLCWDTCFAEPRSPL